MAGWNRGLKEGIKGVAGAEGCLEGYVGREEVPD